MNRGIFGWPSAPRFRNRDIDYFKIKGTRSDVILRTRGHKCPLLWCRFANLTPGADNADLQITFSMDGGANFDVTSSYIWEFVGRDNGGSSISNNSAGAAAISITGGRVRNAAGFGGINGRIDFWNFHIPAVRKKADWKVVGGGCFDLVGGGELTSATHIANKINAVRLAFSGTTIVDGEVYFEGLSDG